MRNNIINPKPVIWLTGISGSGKTTLANKIAEILLEKQIPYELLDGDVVRDFFENDLGYTRRDRLLNIRRITFAAKLLSNHGINVIVANIAPYYEARDFIRNKLPNYFQIYCNASLQEVSRRNVKGLYSDSKKIESPVIGVNDVYDVPRNPDLTINSDTESVNESFTLIMNELKKKGIL